MKAKRANPKKITESMVREAVKKKYTRWHDELKANPNNYNLRKSMEHFKEIHKSKLIEMGFIKA